MATDAQEGLTKGDHTLDQIGKRKGRSGDVGGKRNYYKLRQRSRLRGEAEKRGKSKRGKGSR